jgi:preprotein translocase subunit SecE
MSIQSVQTVNAANEKIKVVIAVCAGIAGVGFFYFFSDKSTATRSGALFVGLLIAVLILSTSALGKGFINFTKESVREAKKVVWPTRKEAFQITAVVFGFVLVMAIFLWSTDKVLEFILYDFILNWRK